MMSLFSSFDWSFQMGTPLILFSVMIAFFSMGLYNTEGLSMGFKIMILPLKSFLLSLNRNFYTKSILVLFLSIMLLLFCSNFISVLPYYFPVTSQLSMVMVLSLSVWGSCILMSTLNNLSSFLIHTISQGAPLILSMFLFLIELVSISIRPLTLTVRMVANIVAGHLLMNLLSIVVLTSMWSFPAYLILNMVEFFVALIQSYIFATLLTLYFSEI